MNREAHERGEIHDMPISRVSWLSIPFVVSWLLVVLSCGSAAAQTPARADILDGYGSAMLDLMPDVSPSAGDQTVTELRARVFADRQLDFGPHLHLSIAGFVEGLVADRELSGGFAGAPVESGRSSKAVARPTDLYAELRFAHGDLRAGASRLVWGRLDEFQPSDVVNPLDVGRFFLEGRGEARMAVGLVRGRVFLRHGVIVEGVVVPWFRRGRFDQLDEATSPFNVASLADTVCTDTSACVPIVATTLEPGAGWRNVQGGGRMTATIGRVDVGASAYRGFEPFAMYTLALLPGNTVAPVPAGPPAAPQFSLLEEFPRFTMVAGDFETVHGPWGVRGEVAWFPEDTLQSVGALRAVPGRSLDIGLGTDRRAGSYRISGNIIASRRRLDHDALVPVPQPVDNEIETTDVLLVGSAERSFARDTRVLRLLAAYDPDADSAFVRGIAALSLRENVWLELSAGWLRGDGLDILSRLSTRDFVYARIKVHF